MEKYERNEVMRNITDGRVGTGFLAYEAQLKSLPRAQKVDFYVNFFRSESMTRGVFGFFAPPWVNQACKGNFRRE